MRLPVQRLAVAAAIAGAVQVGPAYALGGGLKISQPGGVSADTVVSVTGAKIDNKKGSGKNVSVTGARIDNKKGSGKNRIWNPGHTAHKCSKFHSKIIDAASGTGCSQDLNVLNLTVQTLTVQTGSFDNVPETDTGVPSIGSLLSNSTASAYNVTGELKTAGAEGYVTFSSRAPAPLPILGASMAYGFSRKLRKRIAQIKSSALS